MFVYALDCPPVLTTVCRRSLLCTSLFLTFNSIHAVLWWWSRPVFSVSWFRLLANGILSDSPMHMHTRTSTPSSSFVLKFTRQSLSPHLRYKFLFWFGPSSSVLDKSLFLHYILVCYSSVMSRCSFFCTWASAVVRHRVLLPRKLGTKQGSQLLKGVWMLMYWC